MPYFKIKYYDGHIEVAKAKSLLSLIQRRKLYTEEHDNTHVFEITGEQEALSISNED